jgi:glycosyltransferase involved in cell wall biosynthesis
MARIGMNPARNRVSAYRPARVSIAMLVYLPHLTGYFENRFDVVRLSMASLLKHTQRPYDLLIFDNGSCEEVKAWLRALLDAGDIDYLMTSRENIGKLGAMRLISGAAPGELIAYTDDDTFFYPGWLEAHLELLDGFPNVGMVSGCPERTLFDHGLSSNLRLAETDGRVRISRGRRIPDQWEREWAQALGKDEAEFVDAARQLEDIILEGFGLQAYATASHNQFLAPKMILQQALAGGWSGRLMGGLNEMENRLDHDGYLRLTTVNRTTRLIGSIVDTAISKHVAEFGITIHAQRAEEVERRRSGWLSRLARWKPARWLMQGIYNRLFWVLTGQEGKWVEEQLGGEDREDKAD